MTPAEIANLLRDQPWPGFLALQLAAMATIWFAYRGQVKKTQESDAAHLETAKDLAKLAAHVTSAWDDQQTLFSQLLSKFDVLSMELHAARLVQERSLALAEKTIEHLERKAG